MYFGSYIDTKIIFIYKPNYCHMTSRLHITLWNISMLCSSFTHGHSPISPTWAVKDLCMFPIFSLIYKKSVFMDLLWSYKGQQGHKKLKKKAERNMWISPFSFLIYSLYNKKNEHIVAYIFFKNKIHWKMPDATFSQKNNRPKENIYFKRTFLPLDSLVPSTLFSNVFFKF